MKKKLFAIAFLALAMISCEKDNPTTEQQGNEGFIPAKEQQELAKSALQQAIEGYDVSCLKSMTDVLFSKFLIKKQLVSIADSLSAVPAFSQLFNDNPDGATISLSLVLEDSLDITEGDTTLIVVPHATGKLTHEDLHSIDILYNGNKTNIRLGGWTGIDSVAIDEGWVLRYPDKIILSIRQNDKPAFDLNAKFAINHKSNEINVTVETTYDSFARKFIFDFSQNNGLTIHLSSDNRNINLFCFDISTDCDMIPQNDKNNITAWLLNYKLLRGIDVNSSLMNGKVKMQARLSNPFEDPLLIPALIPLKDFEIGKDTIPYDVAEKLIDIISPFTSSSILFEGYNNPQARFSLFGQNGFNPSIISAAENPMILVKALVKTYEAVKTKEVMVIITTVMSLYPSCYNAINEMINGTQTGFIQVLAADSKDEQYIPLWEYLDRSAVFGLFFQPFVEIFKGQTPMSFISSVMQIFPSIVETVKKNIGKI